MFIISHKLGMESSTGNGLPRRFEQPVFAALMRSLNCASCLVLVISELIGNFLTDQTRALLEGKKNNHGNVKKFV